MRPVCLKMSAFGSYAQETVIDFRKVSQGVFLITGDTGSGKTTIFDGITYALYGQTSGGRRDGAMMRSQYADLTTKTYVELEFESRNQIYRVIRNPEYQRESKRKNKDGERTVTKEKGGVELYLPDGSQYHGNRQEVNRKLVEILGVDVRQFSQIAMIAQGDFLKLLLAKSDERKEIFSRIFDTRIFRKVQEELKNRAKELYIQLEDNRKACEREIGQLDAGKEDTAGKEDIAGKEENADREDAAGKEDTAGQENDSGKEAFVLMEEIRELLAGNSREPELARALWVAGQLTVRDQEIYEALQERAKRCAGQLEKQNRIYSLAKERAGQYQELERTQAEYNRLEEEREAWSRKEEQLEWGRKSQEVQPLEQAYLQAVKNLKDTQLRLEKLQKWLDTHGQDTQKRQEQLEKWKEFQQKLEEKEIPVLNRLSQALEQYSGLQSRLSRAVSLETQGKALRQSYQAAQDNYTGLAADYEQVYQAYFREQAGILAAGLKDGQACPVCGSTEHPNKAGLSEHAPTKEQVELLKKKRDAAEKKREDEQRRLLELSGQLEQELAVIRELERQLLGKEEKDDSLDQIRQRWEEWERKAAERLAKGRKQVADTAKRLEESRDSYQKAVQEESQRRGQLEENRKLLKAQEEQAQREQNKFRQAVKRQGFSSEENYRSCRMDRRGMERLEKEIARYQKQVTETGQKKKVLEKQLQGKEKPDMKQIGQELEELKNTQKLLDRDLRRVYSRKEKNRAAYKKLSTLSQERELLRTRYEKVGNISRTANGNLSGNVKIDFESYMQRQYFEQMILCANHHLQRMAAGQFLLRCRSLENLSTQGNAGLDLDVYSLVTGKIRDVKTLSGGESFMAALSLALGMTDVITRTTGAVRMDTLFIDEGFGSLDENSREQAIRILQSLAGGSRLVGIISHVTELKDQIEQQLVVTKTKTGSHAAWK